MVNNRRDTKWAIDFFQPLQKELDLHNISRKATIVKTSTFRQMHFKRMLRCHISVSHKRMEDDAHGFFVFAYEPTSEVFFLAIVLNSKLFKNKTYELKVQRNATAIHEFIHCLAALMSVPKICNNKQWIHDMQAVMMDKLKSKTTPKDILAVINVLKSEIKDWKKIPDILTHDHFKTGYEDFEGNYEDLYIEALLSYNLFIEMFGYEIEKFFECMAKKNTYNSGRILIYIFDKLRKEKDLEHDFIQRQVIKYLFNYSTAKGYKQRNKTINIKQP